MAKRGVKIYAKIGSMPGGYVNVVKEPKKGDVFTIFDKFTSRELTVRCYGTVEFYNQTILYLLERW